MPQREKGHSVGGGSRGRLEGGHDLTEDLLAVYIRDIDLNRARTLCKKAQSRD